MSADPFLSATAAAATTAQLIVQAVTPVLVCVRERGGRLRLQAMRRFGSLHLSSLDDCDGASG